MWVLLYIPISVECPLFFRYPEGEGTPNQSSAKDILSPAPRGTSPQRPEVLIGFANSGCADAASLLQLRCLLASPPAARLRCRSPQSAALTQLRWCRLVLVVARSAPFHSAIPLSMVRCIGIGSVREVASPLSCPRGAALALGGSGLTSVASDACAS